MEADTSMTLVEEDAQEVHDFEESMDVFPDDSAEIDGQHNSMIPACSVLATPSQCTACAEKKEKIIALQKSKSCQRKRLNERNETIKNLKTQNRLLKAVSVI